MKIIVTVFTIIFAFFFQKLEANQDFNVWLTNFKNIAIKKGISKTTVNDVMNNAKFLSKVIEYDRYQPEFYEDTKTYVKKKNKQRKIKKGFSIIQKRKKNNKYYRK